MMDLIYRALEAVKGQSWIYRKNKKPKAANKIWEDMLQISPGFRMGWELYGHEHSKATEQPTTRICMTA